MKEMGKESLKVVKDFMRPESGKPASVALGLLTEFTLIIGKFWARRWKIVSLLPVYLHIQSLTQFLKSKKIT